MIHPTGRTAAINPSLMKACANFLHYKSIRRDDILYYPEEGKFASKIDGPPLL